MADKPIIANWRALLDYLHAEMAHRPNECMRVLHLNSRNMLIRDEVMDEGTIDSTMLHVREVIRRCMELGSASIILVHNHPSGSPGPSKADIDITRALHDTAIRLGIALHDHLIIGTQGHVSLKSQGLF
jgi:DNA repair protein RadC